MKFNWVPGRQGTGYDKLIIFQKLNFDCYLIRYPPKSYIPPHIDFIPNKKHYRLNILLKGEDAFEGNTIFSTKRIKFFRPDINLHSVKEVSVPRLIFSIGWCKGQ